MNKKPKLLIVDDKPENLVALETVLRDLDIELVKATSGNDALKATLRHDFALALLDIQMPDMDGYELAGILREEEKTARLPFIFISAVYTDNLNVFKGYEKGAFSFITKPFQPEILINKVKFFIEKHQQEIRLHDLNQHLEKKNEDLEFINHELEAFTYSVSHDLRAPLRAINGYVEIFKEDHIEKLDQAARHTLDKIGRNALNMATLIDSLLELSRLGRRDVRKGRVNMNLLLKEVKEEMVRSGQTGAAAWRIEDLPDASGDRELLRQVIANLLSNAVKYSSRKDQPLIEVFSEQNGDEQLFYVKDNGCGFNMEYQAKLFGVFQRLHSADEFEGTGIGLAIVRRIVTRHGGRVWARGEMGKGAVFGFSLPAEKN